MSPCHLKIQKVNMIQTKCKHRIFLLLTQSFNHFQVRGLCEVISIYRTCEWTGYHTSHRLSQDERFFEGISYVNFTYFLHILKDRWYRIISEVKNQLWISWISLLPLFWYTANNYQTLDVGHSRTRTFLVDVKWNDWNGSDVLTPLFLLLISISPIFIKEFQLIGCTQKIISLRFTIFSTRYCIYGSFFF